MTVGDVDGGFTLPVYTENVATDWESNSEMAKKLSGTDKDSLDLNTKMTIVTPKDVALD